MRITESQLRKIIKEQLQKTLLEGRLNPSPEQLPDLEKGTAYGLPLPVLKIAGQVYSDNLGEFGETGPQNTISSILTALRETGVKDHTVNNWEKFLRALSDKEINELGGIIAFRTPRAKAAYTKSQANSPQAIKTRTDRATDRWLKTGALKLNEQALDKEKLQTEYNKFIETQQGQTAKNLADTIIKNKGSVSKAGVNESLGNADASLAASGILLGPFLAHLAQQGMGLTPSLATNVFSFLVGVFGGGAVGLGLDYLRHKQGERQQGK